MTEDKDKERSSEPPKAGRNSVPGSGTQVGTRVKEAADILGSRRKAAEAAGVSEDMIYRYIRGQSSPSLESAARLARAAGLSVDYLAGLVFSPNLHVNETAASYASDPTEFVYVPRYDVEAAAGDGASIADERIVGRYAFRRGWIRTKGWDPANLALIQARGDSQEGLIDDGQLVLVNLADDNVRREGIFVLRLDDHLVIKIVQVDHRGTLYIRSNNPAYREIAIPADQVDELNVVGRAVWTDRLL